MPRVLVTGCTGYIGQHIVAGLLRNGYEVLGSVRSLEVARSFKGTLEKKEINLTKLSFVELDLNSSDGWKAACTDCAYVLHVASPFPMKQPLNREALVSTTRAGTLRVMKAAKVAGVRRVVITSSLVAMMYRSGRPQQYKIQVDDWTDPEYNLLSAYVVSKTRAEKAAWDWAKQNNFTQKTTVINPGLVLGPSLGNRYGTSLEVVKMIAEGRYAALPKVSFPIIDVRDLAELHRLAMTHQQLAGERLLAAFETHSLLEIAKALKKYFPDQARRAPTLSVPDFLVRLLGKFDRSLASVLPDLGVIPTVRNDMALAILPASPRSFEETIVDTAISLGFSQEPKIKFGESQLADLSECLTLHEIVGTGSFAEVFRCTDSRDGNTYAFKRLFPEVAGDPVGVARFQNEVTALMNLRDKKHVINGLELGRHRGHIGVLMEYAPGGDLAKKLDDHGRFSIQETLVLAAQLAYGIQEIHDVGVVHRNVKPESVVIDSNGDYRFIDFGVARSDSSPKIYEVGSVASTINYVSPEYMLHSTVDERSDIYAIGCMLYEAYVAESPFKGDSVHEVMTKRLKSDPVAPSLIRPETPQMLDTMILRAMARDRDLRFQAGKEILDFIELNFFDTDS